MYTTLIKQVLLNLVPLTSPPCDYQTFKTYTYLGVDFWREKCWLDCDTCLHFYV